MLAEQVEDSRDDRLLSGYGFDDLYPETLRAYRQVFATRDPGHPWSAQDDLPGDGSCQSNASPRVSDAIHSPRPVDNARDRLGDGLRAGLGAGRRAGLGAGHGSGMTTGGPCAPGNGYIDP